MRPQNLGARGWFGTIERRALSSTAAALLAACSVYDIRPGIDPSASIYGGARYEGDLAICQKRVASTPQQPSRPSGAVRALAAIAIGAGVAGGGAALFGGNTRDAAGWGALTGAAAGFNGWSESLADNPVPSDSLRVEICLQRRGYTVLWANGSRLDAFDPPLER
ncbi:MAG: hypothetical protein ACRC67_09285 [Inquilinus sp.]|uniref:hypothetical protein n=1 Tax=Inquilinus sp. TaxID=1932117 RepID=UPI003F362231